MKNNLVQTLKLRGGSSVGFEFCSLDTASVDDTQVKIASVLSIQHVIFFFICYMALVLLLLHCFKLFMFGLGPSLCCLLLYIDLQAWPLTIPTYPIIIMIIIMI